MNIFEIITSMLDADEPASASVTFMLNETEELSIEDIVVSEDEARTIVIKLNSDT